MAALSTWSVFAPAADAGQHGEGDEGEDAENENPEADDLAGAVALAGVAVPGRTEDDNVDETDRDDDRSPEPA